MRNWENAWNNNETYKEIMKRNNNYEVFRSHAKHWKVINIEKYKIMFYKIHNEKHCKVMKCSETYWIIIVVGSI